MIEEGEVSSLGLSQLETYEQHIHAKASNLFLDVRDFGFVRTFLEASSIPDRGFGTR